MFKPNHIELVIKYIKLIGKTELTLKTMLNDITNVLKGIGTDTLVQYEMKLVMFERKQKLELNK